MFSKIFVSLSILLSSFCTQAAFSPSDERLKDDAFAKAQYKLVKAVDPSMAMEAVGKAKETVPQFVDVAGSVFETPDKLDTDWQWYPQAFGYQRMFGHSQISWGLQAIAGYDILTVKMAPVGPSKKLVIFMHGYLDHSGNYTNFYDELVRNGITVVTFDMPGHGLSSGPRASIQNFEVYGQIMGQLAKQFGREYQEVLLAGFSTGGSAIMEARRMGYVEPSMRAVMIAPLFRIKHYWIAEPAFLEAWNLKYTLGWTWLDAVLSPARQPTVITHDDLYQNVLDADPIAPSFIPELWTMSYIVYADRIEKWSDGLTAAQHASFGDVLVLQGNDDNVVDADVGTEFISRTFSNAKIQWVDDGRHALLNEGVSGHRDILPEVYGSIIGFINK